MKKYTTGELDALPFDSIVYVIDNIGDNVSDQYNKKFFKKIERPSFIEDEYEEVFVRFEEDGTLNDSFYFTSDNGYLASGKMEVYKFTIKKTNVK